MSEDRNNENKSRSKFFILLIVIVLLLVGFAVYQFVQIENLKNGTIGTDASSESGEITGTDLDKLKEKVAKLIEIDTDEEAVASVIGDTSTLADSSFFAQTKKGDVILILLETQRVIIYRESENKLINVGPIVNDSVPEVTPQVVETPPVVEAPPADDSGDTDTDTDTEEDSDSAEEDE